MVAKVLSEPTHRVLVTGGAGFIGAHLVNLLLQKGNTVICADSLWTGSVSAIEHLRDHPRFSFIQHDVREPFPEELVVDQIYHLACPASPDRFPEDPVGILDTNYIGTKNVLELAKRSHARVLFASTSETYGSPTTFPTTESDWGYTNCFGPRSCYDEGKRVSESLCYGYHHQFGVEIRIARIFNTYGPGLAPKDGRVVSNFIMAALYGRPITLYGDGSSTRCFQYVSDNVRGIEMLMQSDYSAPVNLGTTHEFTIAEFAVMVRDLVHEQTGKPLVEIRQIPALKDDPPRRVPDISLAKEVLGWEPIVELADGLKASIEWYQDQLDELPTGPPSMKTGAVNGHSKTKTNGHVNGKVNGVANGVTA